MKKQLYIAYGSNLNVEQMKYRCPGAKIYGTGVIEGYQLQFKGQAYGAFATIAPQEGGFVPVAVWEISRRNEHALDRYEGWPSHYFKRELPVQLGDEQVSAMVYIMNRKMDFGLPSPHYYGVVRQGYQDCGLDAGVLEEALSQSAVRLYTGYRQQNLQRSLFDAGIEEKAPEELDELEDLDGPEDQGPVFSQGGMAL